MTAPRSEPALLLKNDADDEKVRCWRAMRRIVNAHDLCCALHHVAAPPDDQQAASNAFDHAIEAARELLPKNIDRILGPDDD